MPRPEQLNINVATWGRLLKKNNWAKPDLASQDQETKDQDSFAGEYSLLSKFATKVVILSSSHHHSVNIIALSMIHGEVGIRFDRLFVKSSF